MFSILIDTKIHIKNNINVTKTSFHQYNKNPYDNIKKHTLKH